MSANESLDALGALIETAVRQQKLAERSQARLEEGIDALSRANSTISSAVLRSLHTAVGESVNGLGDHLTKQFSHTNKIAAKTAEAYRDAHEQLNLKLLGFTLLASCLGMITTAAVVWYFIYPAAQEAGRLEVYNRGLNAQLQRVCKNPAAAKMPECQYYR